MHPFSFQQSTFFALGKTNHHHQLATGRSRRLFTVRDLPTLVQPFISSSRFHVPRIVSSRFSNSSRARMSAPSSVAWERLSISFCM